jgi:hypothetical protein
MLLDVEGYRQKSNATAEDVRLAVEAMASPNGPTYIILTTPDDSYAQAAGSHGRFVIESREVFGEGFQHWRVHLPRPDGDKPAVITYRRQCPKGKHPPRGCPLSVLACDVMDIEAVATALHQFAVDYTRTERLRWRDVRDEFLRDTDLDVQEIRPR